MTGVGTKLIAAGGAAGAYFSSMFKGAAEVNEASCDREATLQDFGDVNMYRIDKDAEPPKKAPKAIEQKGNCPRPQ
eukprot:5606951-Amphidinium_carterae.1